MRSDGFGYWIQTSVFRKPAGPFASRAAVPAKACEEPRPEIGNSFLNAVAAR